PGGDAPGKRPRERARGWRGGVSARHYGGDDTDLKTLLGGVVGAFAGTEVEEYGRQAAAFVREAHHPTLNRPFAAVGFQPMVELLRYLEANGFTILITSGGS